MAKKFNVDDLDSIEIKLPTVSELILKFMFEIDRHLEDYSIRIDNESFGIAGNLKNDKPPQ